MQHGMAGSGASGRRRGKEACGEAQLRQISPAAAVAASQGEAAEAKMGKGERGGARGEVFKEGGQGGVREGQGGGTESGGGTDIEAAALGTSSRAR